MQHGSEANQRSHKPKSYNLGGSSRVGQQPMLQRPCHQMVGENGRSCSWTGFRSPEFDVRFMLRLKSCPQQVPLTTFDAAKFLNHLT